MKSDKIQLMFVVIGTVILLLYNLFFHDVSLTIILSVLSVGVSIFGLPHGAIDGYLAQRTGFAKDLKSVCVFVFTYLFISGLVVVAWLLVPDATFFLFLLITVWHFGKDSGSQKPFDRLLFGLCVITLPPLFHSNHTTELFQLLAIRSADEFVRYMQALAPIIVLVSMALSLRQKVNGAKGRISVLTILAMVVFSYALPPLLFFTVYFCALHSPKHFKSIAVSVPKQERSNFLSLIIIYTFVTIILAGTAMWILMLHLVFDQAFILVIFVGLSALTVPHMILVDGIWALKRAREN